MKCKSVYYGQMKDWHCKLEAGHAGPHAADIMDWRGKCAQLAEPNAKLVPLDGGKNYCTWTDEDEQYTLMHKFCIELGGK